MKIIVNLSSAAWIVKDLAFYGSKPLIIIVISYRLLIIHIIIIIGKLKGIWIINLFWHFQVDNRFHHCEALLPQQLLLGDLRHLLFVLCLLPGRNGLCPVLHQGDQEQDSCSNPSSLQSQID